jgi:hypothetical protein
MSTKELCQWNIYNLPSQNLGYTNIESPPFFQEVPRFEFKNLLMARDESCATPEWIALQLQIDLQGSEGFDAAVGEGILTTLETIAAIRWGNRNAQFRAEVDWRTGTIIHLPATYVEIKPVVLQPAGGSVPAVNWTRIMYSAALCPATVPQSKPTRSFGRITLDAAAEVTLEIPPFTTEIAAFSEIVVSPLASIEVRQVGGSVAGVTYDATTLDEYACCGRCVHGHARWLRLTNTAGAPITFSLMAFLGL